MSFQIGELFNLDYWQQMFSGDLFSLNFLVNILDILVVWYLVYKLIQLLRGTKAIQLLKGVAIFIVIRIVAEIIGLHTLSWLMNQVITYGVIAAIVIFQPEIRRGLEHLGRSSLFKQSKSEQQEDEKMILSFDKAIQYMSKRKIGALITIERHTGLDEYIETGIALDADITGELLINIFIPNTPLHDGAVIVKEGKIAVASAYLPLSESMLIPKEFGTRHRAAVGISEVSDAITIVVSEETGDVSITLDNELMAGLSQQEYLAILRRELIAEEKTKNKKNVIQSFLDGMTKGGDQFVPQLVSQLFDWAKSSQISDLVKSCILHFELEIIHPFEDGNGRMGRLWQSLVLSRFNPIFEWLPVESLIYKHQEGYYNALTISNHDDDATVFIEFMLEAIYESLQEYQTGNHLEEDGPELTDKEVEVFQKIKSYLQVHSHISNAQAKEVTGLSQASVRRYLASFLEKDLLTMTGSTRDRQYRLKIH